MTESTCVIAWGWGNQERWHWRTRKGSFWGNGDAHYLDGCDGFMGVHICQILSNLHFKYVPFIVSDYTLMKLLTKIVLVTCSVNVIIPSPSVCLYDLDSTCLGLNLVSPNELRLHRIDIHYSACLSPLSYLVNRIVPLSVNCCFSTQKHGSPWSCQSQRSTLWPLRDGDIWTILVNVVCPVPNFPGLCYKLLIPATFFRGLPLGYWSCLTSRAPELKISRRLYFLRVTYGQWLVYSGKTPAPFFQDGDKLWYVNMLQSSLWDQGLASTSSEISFNWLFSSSSFSHSLNISHWENFLNQTTCTWTQPKAAWQVSLAQEIYSGMELRLQWSASES